MLKIMIAINPTDIIKHKISVIYKKLENNFDMPLYPFHCAKF